MKLHYIGHSAFALEFGDELILIDPFISGNPKAIVNFDIKKTTKIFVTHGHSDHLGDAIKISKQLDVPLFAIFELANYSVKKGANAVGCSIGGKLNFDFGWARFVPAFHSSSTPDGFYAGMPAGIVINVNNYTIYHSGDTSLTYEMKMIKEAYSPDLAMLPIGSHFTMDVDDAVMAAKYLNAKHIIPMHYNTFPLIEANAQEFKLKIEQQGQICSILSSGDFLKIE